MADQIVPRTVFDIASDLETESSKMEACLGLMHAALQHGIGEEYLDDIRRAHDQIHFLVSSLDDLRVRLDALTGAAYDLAQRA